VKYKLLIIFIFVINSFAAELVFVPISIKNINYREEVSTSNYKKVEYNDLNKRIYNMRCRNYLTSDDLVENLYRAKHYIKKGKIICKKDVYLSDAHKIKFNFGLLEIEKDGEILNETSKYIRIKNADGTIEKIYKGIK